MDKLRSTMGHGHYALTLDPSKGGLALQEASTHHSLQQLSYDPSFAERAAKYSTFGNNSNMNYRSSQQQQAAATTTTYSSFDTGRLRDVLLENNNIESPIPRSASFSSEDQETKPSLTSGTALEGEATTTKGVLNEAFSSDGVSSQENSSGGSQRKRKGSNAVKGKELSPELGATPTLKRQRSGDGESGKLLKAERITSGSENSGDSTVSPRSLKGGATSKAPQEQQQLPKQDYIHVRARRGQATDSHSLAERVRREKISERMKFLQDLVPGCSKVTGKAVMLDEIINYVQSLQRQIEFLSMKLAAVNPRLDYCNYDQLLGKDLLQSRSPETTLLGPDPLGYGDLHSGHGHGQVPLHMPSSLDMRGVEGLCDSYLRRSMSVPSMASLVSDDHFSDPLSQAVSLCNGDLQSIVEMGFIHGRQGLGLGTQLSHGSSMCLPGKLKVEM